MSSIVSKYEPYRRNINFIKKYIKAKNAASGSEVDANSNVANKNIATMASEVHKRDNIYTKRLWMYDEITKLFDKQMAENFLEDIENHRIYMHDESGIVGMPYCASITLYPFLYDGMKKLGGTSDAPQHLKSFIGGFVNLVFAVAAQLCGAVATPEFLAYMDYFIRKGYGDDYYLNVDRVVDLSNDHETIDNVITGYFDQAVYSLNQPAGARGFQSVFWNIAYFDKPYFDQLFEGFVFPDGSSMKWESVSWLQKRFMKWFNQERTRKILTFPVETMSLLNDGKDSFVDEEWADFAAEMYSEGHSFFTYTSDSVDSLASCCRLRNGIQDNTFSYTLGAGGVSTGSKCVMTININRLVQDAKRDGIPLREAVAAQVDRVHKYLLAFNSIIKEMQGDRMLPLYDAGFVSPEKQYLTVGINGLVEGAEFLGIEPINGNQRYKEYVNDILCPIREANKRDRTKEIMWNTEYVPNPSNCGDNKPSLMDSKLCVSRQRGASVMAA